MQYLCDLRDTRPCHWSPATSHPTCYRECYGFERAFFTLRHFLPCTPSCCFQGFPGSRQFILKVSRASCWSSKHSPSPTICLNHGNPQMIYTGRFHLRARAGQSRNINFYRQNNNLEMFTFYGIWTIFAVGEDVTSLMFYPFGHKALQTVINFS